VGGEPVSTVVAKASSPATATGSDILSTTGELTVTGAMEMADGAADMPGSAEAVAVEATAAVDVPVAAEATGASVTASVAADAPVETDASTADASVADASVAAAVGAVTVPADGGLGTNDDNAGDNESTNIGAGGEPAEAVARRTEVTQTLEASALLAEPAFAPETIAVEALAPEALTSEMLTPEVLDPEVLDPEVLGEGEPTAQARRPSAVWDAAEAVTEIYHAHYGQFVRLSVLLLHDVQEAEEVVQEAFEAMHVAWRRLNDKDKALQYLRQTVVNKSRSVLRHRKVVDMHAPKPAPDEPSAEHGALVLLERSAVADALRALPERQREAIVLRYYADFSEADIAKAMGISKGAVKSHTARAMSTLKAVLTQATS
jgi:RNA polymerase sigma-70 factor (sigma-E family)